MIDESVVVAIFFGVLTIIVTIYNPVDLLRRSRYPAKITFIENICSGLFDSMVLKIPEVRVTYNDQTFGEDLVLLEGYLVNTGWKDISPEMVEQQLSLVLPAEYKWLKVVASSPQAEVSAQLRNDDREIVFHMGLLRRKEYIEFTALAQAPSGMRLPVSQTGNAARRLRRDMRFRQRISDMQPVEEYKLRPSSISISMRRYIVSSPVRVPLVSVPLFVFSLLIGLLSLIVWIGDSASQRYIPYLAMSILYFIMGILMAVGYYITSRRDEELRSLLSQDERE